MDERHLVQRIERAASRTRSPGVVLGIGDDAAVFRPKPAEDLVFTTDMLIEGVHFRRETHAAPFVGRKALTRGLSDVAAMGADPRFCLVSLALAPWSNTAWVDGFYDGLFALAAEHQCPLIGGDLSHAAKVACDIAVCGAVPRGSALRRDGASPGDRICVSGLLGGSTLGLTTRKGDAWERHRNPVPRVALGRLLREQLRATAAMDLTDGLALDLHRLCIASRVGAMLDRDLPLFPGATVEQALHGGEDYELLFTVRPGTEVPPEIAGIPLTPIGSIVAAQSGRSHITWKGHPIEPLGYDHFKNR